MLGTASDSYVNVTLCNDSTAVSLSGLRSARNKGATLTRTPGPTTRAITACTAAGSRANTMRLSATYAVG